MDAVAHGDAGALTELVERYHAPLRGYFARLLTWERGAADDLVQETFVRLLRQRSYSGERAFRPWLYAVATNVARDHWRRRDREPVLSDAESQDQIARVADASPGPERWAEDRDELRQVSRALSGLSEEYRIALVLRYNHDLSLAEIATVLGIPVGTVKSRLSVGARKLRRALDEIDAEAGT